MKTHVALGGAFEGRKAPGKRRPRSIGSPRVCRSLFFVGRDRQTREACDVFIPTAAFFPEPCRAFLCLPLSWRRWRASEIPLSGRGDRSCGRISGTSSWAVWGKFPWLSSLRRRGRARPGGALEEKRFFSFSSLFLLSLASSFLASPPPPPSPTDPPCESRENLHRLSSHLASSFLSLSKKIPPLPPLRCLTASG